ncbi:PqqD family protein [bacterium]|nr:PqqD family protein [bacterium]MBU4362655.1 PqqD family protein [bacterium]MBU4601616.1 PqqD family protein [bacterium]
MLEVNKILQLKEEYILHKLDIGNGKFWLFNIENGDVYKLNRISYTILSLIDGKSTVGEINRCLFDKYPNKKPDLILKDFEELIERVRIENIINERR